MFSNIKNLKSIQFKSYNNTDFLTSMKYIFKGDDSLVSVNFFNLKTINVKSMAKMFDGCSSLKSINLSNFDTKM